MHRERFYAAVDLGATNVRISYGNAEGLKEKRTEKTDRESGPEGISDQIIQMLEYIDVRLSAIGVGSIGPIYLETGTIINTPNLPFERIPVVEPLSEAFKVPVGMLNDCSAAVLGEQVFGAGKGLKNLAYVTLSTGLGGGAIVDGNLLIGKDGNAVEVGHLTIDPDSPLVCGCGCRGHWEAYCSGSHIPKYARLLIAELELDDTNVNRVSGGDQQNLTTEGIYKAATEGDPTAKEIVRRLKIRSRLIDISPMVDAYYRRHPDRSRLRKGNKLARERMSVLYDFSAREKALVIGTGNKTETLLGYCTLHGDAAYAFNPIGDLYKSQVRLLAKELGVPQKIIDKPPSADLWKGQTDEKELGVTYDQVDRLLYYLVDKKYSPSRLKKLGFKPSFIKKVIGMMRGSDFKRRPAEIARIDYRKVMPK